MIVLHLTSQTNKMKVFIAAKSVTVTDNANQTDFYTERIKRGCCVQDGLHNNGGWNVEESYDQVIAMIESQIKPSHNLALNFASVKEL